jgi:hypothetical protein
MRKLTFLGAAALMLAAVNACAADPLDSETEIPAKTGHVPYAPALTLQPNRIAPAPANPRVRVQKNGLDEPSPLGPGFQGSPGAAVPPLTPGVPNSTLGIPSVPSAAQPPVLPVLPNPRTGPGGFTPPTPANP